MDCVGIVAEYNPFHRGHLYHLEEARRLSGGKPVIVVMSGNYVQRGEPAMWDQWTRTRAALLSGASIVLELPARQSTQSSELYARSAVGLLISTGLVSAVSFGTEAADKALLDRLAEVLIEEPDIYKDLLKRSLDEGLGFAAARAKALASTAGCAEELLLQPNLILAIEYVKALRALKADLEILPVKRLGSYHSSPDPEAPSASVLRDAFREGKDISASLPIADVFAQAPAVSSLDDWSQELYYALLSQDADSLARFRDVGEGLENRILKAFDRPRPISEAVDLISTKRYPKARIRRILLHLLLDIKKEPWDDACPYLRVLGFRKDAEALLSEMTRSASLPVITNPARQLPQLPDEVQKLFLEEARATDLYFAHVPGTDAARGADLTTPILKI